MGTQKKKRKPYERISRNGEAIENFIEEWRNYHGIKSQMDLARQSGLPSQTINRLEAHRLAWTVFSLKKLAAVLKCEPWELIGRNPNERPPEFIELYEQLNTDEVAKTMAFMREQLEARPKKRRARAESVS